MQRLTIIPVDKAVYKQGVPHDELDLSSCGVPENVHALHWDGSVGSIEFIDDAENEEITSLPDWAVACEQVWDQEDYSINNPPEPTDQEKIELNKFKASKALLESDWTQLADVNLTEQCKAEWVAYRTQVRAIVLNPAPDSVFPVEPVNAWV